MENQNRFEQKLYSQWPGGEEHDVRVVPRDYFYGQCRINWTGKSIVQCPSCLHYVFEGTIVCSCGKHIRCNQEMIQRIRKAFEVFSTPFLRASHPNSKSYKHGSQLWQRHHHKASDALRAATRKKYRTLVNMSGFFQKLPKPLVGTMRWYDISTTSYRLISLTKLLLNNEADITLWYIYEEKMKVCKACRW